MTSLLRLPAVRERTGLSRSKIYEMMGEGKFPKPIKHSERVNVWPSDQVDAWIAARIAENAGN